MARADAPLRSRSWSPHVSALFVSLATPHPAHASETPDFGNAPYEWNYVFPIWGKDLASKGLLFPYPFGIGVTYLEAVQPIDVKNLEVAVNDGEFTDVSRFVKFESLDSNVQALNARFDLWVAAVLERVRSRELPHLDGGGRGLVEAVSTPSRVDPNGLRRRFRSHGRVRLLRILRSPPTRNFHLEPALEPRVTGPHVRARSARRQSASSSRNTVADLRGGSEPCGKTSKPDTSGTIKLSEAVGKENAGTVEG